MLMKKTCLKRIYSFVGIWMGACLGLCLRMIRLSWLRYNEFAARSHLSDRIGAPAEAFDRLQTHVQ
jgi:hypothetical protein